MYVRFDLRLSQFFPLRMALCNVHIYCSFAAIPTHTANDTMFLTYGSNNLAEILRGSKMTKMGEKNTQYLSLLIL